MTSIVALRCADGVVIGADSAVTFGAKGGQLSTIEHHTSQKLRLVNGGRMVLGGTGQLGLLQRFHAAVSRASQEGVFDQATSGIEVGKRLADIGLRDFSETHLQQFDFSALVAFEVLGKCYLCELDGDSGFQPELKDRDDLWYVSKGAGQAITDPFLALLQEAFWAEAPPSLTGGIFTALWALKHVCKLNAGGIGDPVHIAVMKEGDLAPARLLNASELAEHDNMVEAAMRHLGTFRDILEGRSSTEIVPSMRPSIQPI